MNARYLPGDIVMRRKGPVMHKGIALDDGRILHNTIFTGEHVSSEQEFRRGRRVRVERLDRTERRNVLRAAHSDSRRPYNLFTNNCEHTVYRARSGRGDSPQLKSFALGLAFGAAGLVLTRHPAVAVAGFALGCSIGRRVFNPDSSAAPH